jgi:ribosomal protein S18 acetylase RimI-like enzyme
MGGVTTEGVPVPDVRLDPMTDEEFAAFLREAVVTYADAHVEAGSWPAEGAHERSVEEHARLLPQGLATPGHHLYTARDGDDRIGVLWLARRPHGTGEMVFVYNVEVEASRRGRGYGAAIMRAAEERTSADGLDRLQLHVFGDNEVARSLYRKLGYAETNVVMAKQLQPSSPQDRSDRSSTKR